MISDLYISGWKVKRLSQVKVSGVFKPTYVAHLSDISVHKRQLNAREVLQNAKLEVTANWRMYADALESDGGDRDITEKDIMIDPDGKAYDIQRINNPHGLNHHLEIDCSRTGVEEEHDV